MKSQTIIVAFSFGPAMVSSFVDRYGSTIIHPSYTWKSQSAFRAFAEEGESSSWLGEALLVSSFSDGIKPNQDVHDVLMCGLVKQLWKERQELAENEVAESVLQSPCCGPDLDSLTNMEAADAAIAGLDKEQQPWEELLDSLKSDVDSQHVELRFLYIPTAMYALRSDSNNTPGKQRQRARADGKKRRNEIVKLLSEKLGDDVSVLAVTLDLDDASVKQPEGSDDPSRFPTNGKQSINEWKPHFIYVQGGNTFWLYHCIEKGDWGEDIVNACTGENPAFYCGTSAGAIIMGASMETACWKGWDDPSVVPGKETYDDWKGVKGFSLAGDASFFPHMGEQWRPLVEEKRTELAGDNVFCLRDDEVCYVNGSDKSIAVFSHNHQPLA